MGRELAPGAFTPTRIPATPALPQTSQSRIEIFRKICLQCKVKSISVHMITYHDARVRSAPLALGRPGPIRAQTNSSALVQRTMLSRAEAQRTQRDTE